MGGLKITITKYFNNASPLHLHPRTEKCEADAVIPGAAHHCALARA